MLDWTTSRTRAQSAQKPANASIAAALAGILLLALTQPAVASQQSKSRSSQQASVKRKVVDNGYEVTIDLRKQKLSLDANKPERVHNWVYPSLSNVKNAGFVSAAMMAMKSKQFDDGLMAAVKLASQSGKGNVPSKRLMLASISKYLENGKPSGEGNAVRVVLGATTIGDESFQLSSPWQAPVSELVQDFANKDNAVNSKPIGFYTWSPQLEQIYRQDRMLQTKLEGPAETAEVAAALRNVAGARRAYEAHLNLASALTNPLSTRDLRSLINNSASAKRVEKNFAFFPVSDSPESTMLNKLFGNRAVPQTFNLSEELVAQVKSGKLNLAPKPNSGWYSYQLWALEPLLNPEKTPEGMRLKLNDGYKLQLIELFKGLMALSRETQFLNITGAGGGGGRGDDRTVIVKPDLTVEPMATFYLRKAIGYKFVADVLVKHFGKEALNQMHRVTASGASKQSLAQELREMQQLFVGAYALSCRQLGVPHGATRQVPGTLTPGAIAFFTRWAKTAPRDPDVIADARMMVPIFTDPSTKKTKVWVMLGWCQSTLSIDWLNCPDMANWKYVPVNGKIDRKGSPHLSFEGDSATTCFPLTMELYVSNVLNRDEFRTVCDATQSSGEIVKALQAEK